MIGVYVSMTLGEQETPDNTLIKLIKKIEKIEKQVEELVKQQKLLQDAFYRLYENQRRAERVL